jgi:hypothetical protein
MATDEIKMDIIFRLIVPQSQLRDVVMYLLPFMDDDAYAEMRIHAEDDAPINETCDECGGQGEPVCPLCDQTMYRCGDMWGCDRCNLCINTHADCMAPLKKPDGSDDHSTPWTPLNPDKQGTPNMEPATDWIPCVKFDKDGDQWMCAGVDFNDLAKDPAGFGLTKVEAYKAYLQEVADDQTGEGCGG